MLEEVAERVVSRLTEVSIDSGDATSGSLTTIVDTTKNWEVDKWKDAIVEVEVDDVHYYRTISSNTADTLTITTLPAGHPVASGDHYNIRLSVRIATISGQTVKISGQTVIAKISGEIVYVSGQPVKVSGETVIAKVSGEIVYVSGQPVKVSGQTVIAKVSGEAVKISGQTVIGKVSGETIIAKVSGETIVAKVSGEVVKVSGEVVSIETPTMLKTGPVRTLTSVSGGVVLHSGSVKAAVVKALTDNSGVVLVGGSGDRPWYESVGSAQGMILAAGEAQSKDVSNFDAIYVVAQVSGDKVSFDGVY